MKRSKELLTALVNENYLKTKEIIHEELYSKVGSAIDGIREDAYAVVFNEAKKAKKTDDEDDGPGSAGKEAGIARGQEKSEGRTCCGEKAENRYTNE